MFVFFPVCFTSKAFYKNGNYQCKYTSFPCKSIQWIRYSFLDRCSTITDWSLNFSQYKIKLKNCWVKMQPNKDTLCCHSLYKTVSSLLFTNTQWELLHISHLTKFILHFKTRKCDTQQLIQTTECVWSENNFYFPMEN